MDTSSAGASDDVSCTFSYGQMCKDVIARVGGRDFHNIHHLTYEIAELANTWPGETLKITVIAPKALLRVEGGLGRNLVLRRRDIGQMNSLWDVSSHEWFIQGLNIACIIGVNEHERLEKQMVNIRLKMMGGSDQEQYKNWVGGEDEIWRSLVRRVCEVSNRFTCGCTSLKCSLLLLGRGSIKLPNTRGIGCVDSSNLSRSHPIARNYRVAREAQRVDLR